jgi:N-acetylglutamate synthase-like GNAT family acetyltransferase
MTTPASTERTDASRRSREGGKHVAYRPAREGDRPAVLAVLRCANFHRIPSPEMPELDLGRFFVAEVDDRIVGVAGYKLLGDGIGKTTLMAVLPEYRGLGIGECLQRLRMTEMRSLGCRVAITNADLPATLDWYQRKFGYRVVGRLRKLHEFGAPDIDHWTTMEADLLRWSPGPAGPGEAS